VNISVGVRKATESTPGFKAFPKGR